MITHHNTDLFFRWADSPPVDGRVPTASSLTTRPEVQIWWVGFLFLPHLSRDARVLGGG